MRRDPTDYATASANRVGGVARRVLSVLSHELGQNYPDTPSRVLVRFLDQLQVAVMQPGPAPVEAILNLMRRSGIRDADIADFYIPVIARRLGEDWVADRMDFTQVTLGSTRLQSILRALDASWCTPEDQAIGMRGEYCIIVPEGVQHSLGARILAGQLRRAGCNVHLKIELPLTRIGETVRAPALAGVFLSATLRESLDFLRRAVAHARSGNAWVPVLIGGNVLDRGDDLRELIGVDHATNDWQAALSFCEARTRL